MLNTVQFLQQETKSDTSSALSLKLVLTASINLASDGLSSLQGYTMSEQ